MAKTRSAQPKSTIVASGRQRTNDLREFRKTNEAIGLRLREGKLSLLTRKLFNVMMYHAQKMRDLGVNAPIDTAAAKKYFWIPLSDLARDAAYESRDVEFLRRQLEELQGIRLLLEDERRWTSENLVAGITFVNPRGLHNKHAGQVWFGFAFPPEVHELVMSPGTYTRLSIVYQGTLRSGAALALYEICRRYAGSPSGVTFSEVYPHWYGVLTGNPVGDTVMPYKYFKRDVLKPAMAEVNLLTDIEVDLIEHRAGRRVERLQFAVRMAKQPQLDFPTPPVIDTELFDQVMAFGFTQQEAADMVAQHGDARIREVAALVEARRAAKSSPPLDSPAAYFRWALRQGAAPAPQLAAGGKRRASVEHKAGQSVMERFLSARAQEAYSLYQEMSPAERELVLARFEESGQARKLKIDADVSHPMTRAVFGRWYAQDLWGDPTTQALAEFIERFEQLGPAIASA